MAKLFLSLHVLAGIIFIGPVTVAVSLFPRYARLAADDTQRAVSLPILRLLSRISSVYAVLGLSVPVLGISVATQLGVLGDAWLITAIALTLLAAGLLAVVILPAQQRMLREVDDTTEADPIGEPYLGLRLTWPRSTGQLAALSGVFALIWATVVVLMVVRPGSTTGV